MRARVFLIPLFFAALSSTTGFAAITPPQEEIIPLGTNERAAEEGAQPKRVGPRAELLGQIRLGNRPHRGSVRGRACSRVGEGVRALRFRVLGESARLISFQAHFTEEASPERSLRATIPANSETPWISVAGHGQRCLSGITVEGQNENLSPRPALVQIFALVDDSSPAIREQAKNGLRPPHSNAK